jgi:hypothetical protein
MMSLVFMTAARIRNSAALGAGSVVDGVGTELSRWRFERDATERSEGPSLGSEEEIFYAED